MEIDTTTVDIVKKKKFKWWKFWLFFILIAATAFYFCFLRPFSEGFREGYVTKLSKKGFIFKTWEGELIRNQISVGTTVDIFKFSIANDKVAKTLNDLDQRKYLKLHYKEYLFQIFFKGDTKYFIDNVEVLPDVNNFIPNTIPGAR